VRYGPQQVPRTYRPGVCTSMSGVISDHLDSEVDCTSNSLASRMHQRHSKSLLEIEGSVASVWACEGRSTLTRPLLVLLYISRTKSLYRLRVTLEERVAGGIAYVRILKKNSSGCTFHSFVCVQ